VSEEYSLSNSDILLCTY